MDFVLKGLPEEKILTVVDGQVPLIMNCTVLSFQKEGADPVQYKIDKIELPLIDLGWVVNSLGNATIYLAGSAPVSAKAEPAKAETPVQEEPEVKSYKKK